MRCVLVTEMIHTASLCHDNVVDNALIRRGSPASWRITSPSGGILVGDVRPLFAFLARACGGQDQTLGNALEEAGYCVVAAYQLADDLLDMTGKEDTAEKALGTDARRRKFTLPQSCGEHLTRQHVEALCISAVDCLRDYPEQRRGLEQFLGLDLQPVLRQHRCGRQVPSRLEV